MDRNRQKYVELSLAGKWVCLAREIILDNPGIEESRFIEIAAPLMPTHIERRKVQKIGQAKLARESITQLVKTCKSVSLIDGKLTSKPRGALRKCHSKEILDFAINNENVRTSDLPHIKYFSTLANRLCKRNLLKMVEKGVFSIVEKKCDAT